VNALFSMALASRVVLVQGTPAVGKTTLLNLVWWHVDSLQGSWAPEGSTAPLRLFKIFGWQKDNVQANGGWAQHIKHKTHGELDLHDISGIKQPYLLLIDDAQSTYWDHDFWGEFVKEIAQDATQYESGHRIHHLIMFSAYGSSMPPPSLDAADHQPTPPFLEANQYVSLMPQPSLPWQIGLLFTQDEFMDAYKRRTTRGELGGNWVASDDVAKFLFDVTQGHPGALTSLLDCFARHKASLSILSRCHYLLKLLTRRKFLETISGQGVPSPLISWSESSSHRYRLHLSYSATRPLPGASQTLNSSNFLHTRM